ncbi:MAG: CBS domain-containing protein [Pseudomonadota bacterium]
MDTQTETPQTLEPGTIRLAISGDRDALAAVTEVLRGSDTAARKALAAAVAPTDAIRLILRLKSKDAKRLLKALPDTPSLRVLNELDPALAGDLVDEGLRARLHKLVSRLHEDAAAEFLAGMPSSLRADLLNDLGNPAELLSRLDHADDSAGAVMAHDAIYTTAERTIGEVIEQIRANSDRIRRIYAVYVVDERRHLIGALKMRDLLLNPDDCPVSEVMRLAPKAVTADRDRAEVVHEAEAAGLPVLPVVDGDGKLLGRITPEELREIDQAEADEDIKIMAGLRPDSSALDTPFQIVPRRLPAASQGSRRGHRRPRRRGL